MCEGSLKKQDGIKIAEDSRYESNCEGMSSLRAILKIETVKRRAVSEDRRTSGMLPELSR